MNRIDRISAILIQLQSRRVVKAQDIAERFNISLRTVYRDMKTLEEAGVPLIGEAGTGYSLMDGYRLPPVMFSREEATALVTAQKLVEKLTDTTTGMHYESALFKIKSVLRSNEKDYLAGMDDRIEVLGTSRAPQISEHLNPMQTILQAIAGKNVIDLHYFVHYRQEDSNRLVEPVGVFFLDRHWHLIAWCRNRQAYRDFRFDRIRQLTVIDEIFTKQHPTLTEYMRLQYRERNLQTVVMRVASKAIVFLGDQKYYQGYVGETQGDGYAEMTFMTESLEGFARWYMMFADYAEIMEPEALLTRVKTLLENYANKLKVLNLC